MNWEYLVGAMYGVLITFSANDVLKGYLGRGVHGWDVIQLALWIALLACWCTGVLS